MKLCSLDEASGTEVNSTGSESLTLLMNILLTCDRDLINVLFLNAKLMINLKDLTVKCTHIYPEQMVKAILRDTRKCVFPQGTLERRS